MVAAVFRTIFAQPDAETVAATWDEVRDQLAKSFAKIGPLMDEAKTEVLAFTASLARTGQRSGRPTRRSG
jgi:transposase-like protein